MSGPERWVTERTLDMGDTPRQMAKSVTSVSAVRFVTYVSGRAIYEIGCLSTPRARWMTLQTKNRRRTVPAKGIETRKAERARPDPSLNAGRGFGTGDHMKAADILLKKGNKEKTDCRDDTIGTLSKRLHEERVGAMFVSEDGKSLDGIISERDVAYCLHSRRGDLHLEKVSVLKTRDVVTCTPRSSLQKAAAIMAEQKLRHLAVVEGGYVVGIISMRDVFGYRLQALSRRTDTFKKLVTVNQV